MESSGQDSPRPHGARRRGAPGRAATMRSVTTWSDRVPDRDGIKSVVNDICFKPDGTQLVAAVGNRAEIAVLFVRAEAFYQEHTPQHVCAFVCPHRLTASATPVSIRSTRLVLSTAAATPALNLRHARASQFPATRNRGGVLAAGLTWPAPAACQSSHRLAAVAANVDVR